jgi:hypothetical protein
MAFLDLAGFLHSIQLLFFPPCSSSFRGSETGRRLLYYVYQRTARSPATIVPHDRLFFDHRSLLGARVTDITFAMSVSASLNWRDHCQSPGNCSPGPISVNVQRPSPVHSRILQGTANNGPCTSAKKPRKKRALFNEGDTDSNYSRTVITTTPKKKNHTRLNVRVSIEENNQV